MCSPKSALLPLPPLIPSFHIDTHTHTPDACLTPTHHPHPPHVCNTVCMHSACCKAVASRAVTRNMMKLLSSQQASLLAPSRTAVTCSSSSSSSRVPQQPAPQQPACTGPPLSPRRVKAMSYLSRRQLCLISAASAASQQLGEFFINTNNTLAPEHMLHLTQGS